VRDEHERPVVVLERRSSSSIASRSRWFVGSSRTRRFDASAPRSASVARVPLARRERARGRVDLRRRPSAELREQRARVLWRKPVAPERSESAASRSRARRPARDRRCASTARRPVPARAAARRQSAAAASSCRCRSARRSRAGRRARARVEPGPTEKSSRDAAPSSRRATSAAAPRLARGVELEPHGRHGLSSSSSARRRAPACCTFAKRVERARRRRRRPAELL
jgi:hypothetical protein